MSKLIRDIQKINDLGIEIQELDASISIVSSPELQLIYEEKMNEVLSDYNKLCAIVKTQLEEYLADQKARGEPMELNYFRLLKELKNDRRQ